MKSVALIGSNGFVGSSIKKFILNNKEISTTCITRENYEEAKLKKEYDNITVTIAPD